MYSLVSKSGVKWLSLMQVQLNSVVTLLKQIMTPTEWSTEISPNVLQTYHHSLQLIASTSRSAQRRLHRASIKITLAFRNVREPLANALSFSVNEKPTWNDTHTLLTNYFNTSIPSDTKEVYQFNISGKVSREDSVNQVGKRERVNQRSQIKEVKRTIQGQGFPPPGFFSESKSERKGEVKGTIKRED